MRKLALAGTAILALSLTLTACSGAGEKMNESTDSTSSSMSSDAMMSPARMGDFAGLNDKMVAGTVEVTDSMITLAGFSSDEGPDLHLYLTNGTDEAAVEAGMQIDAVAFDQASQSFMLDGVNVAEYDTVVIHCDKAKAVFGAAPLSEDGDDMAAAMQMGTFSGLNGKNVAGTATIDGDTVTLAGFSSHEGPDLHLYLTNGTDEAAVDAGMEIGMVAFAEASQTLMLDGVDTSGYTHLVIHCDKAKAVFGAAPLA